MKTYTLEVYWPPFQTKREKRVHVGSFADVRDSLSPSMVKCREIRSDNIGTARVQLDIFARRIELDTFGVE